MEKRVLLALAISFMILGFYPSILKHFYPEYGKAQVTRSASNTQAADKSSSVTAASAVNDGEFSSADDVIFRNDKLNLLFNLKGSAIREISFLEFTDIDRKGPLRLISAQKISASSLSVGVVYPALERESRTGKVTMDKDRVTLESAVLNGDMKITKNYVFRRTGYSADLSVTFQNASGKSMDLQYEFFAGASIPSRHSIDAQYIEANFFTSGINKSDLRHINESKLGKRVESQGPLDWIAVKDRHFSVIVKPKADKTFSGVVEGLGDHRFSAALVSPRVMLAPGASVTHEFLVYMGPNDLGELLPLGLEDIVNFGKLDLVGKICIGALEMLHKIFKNYGLAIIGLTLLINLILFPFTRQSMMSMKRMQLVQPLVTKLREQFKDNPQRMNKEMMELYKKHKVNPFGGCLPMLLQMPVFIALYVAISKFVKLIGADFLWIHDLSSPDVVSLPVSLPFIGSQIHLLPIIMIGGMVLQQRLSSMSAEGQDPAMAQQQKMMAIMMPIMFGFIFYTMPSALVLYWLTNTIFMTSYQLYLKKITITL